MGGRLHPERPTVEEPEPVAVRWTAAAGRSEAVRPVALIAARALTASQADLRQLA